jgi:serine protease Do
MNKFLISILAVAFSFIPIQAFSFEVPQSLSPLVEKVRSESVLITSTMVKNGSEQISTGTGYISDGTKDFIITNNHVVSGGTSIHVELFDGHRYAAQIVATDPKTDIALLKLDTPVKLPQITWGNSDEVKVGDWAMAIGNPYGLKSTVTLGIISALHRDNQGPYDDLIQTDASINKGNSGGPLYNMKGEVIGMNSEIISPSGTSAGLGFAIPSNEIVEITDQLERLKHVVRGYIGIMVQSLTADTVSALQLSSDDGALVVGIAPDGPASKTKLRTGDIVLKIDNQVVTSVQSLPKIVATLPVGKEVNIQVFREGEVVNIPITIAELTETNTDSQSNNDDDPQSYSGPEQNSGLVIDGMKLTTANGELCAKYNHALGACHGALVINIEVHGPADIRGVKVGDIITGINQHPVNDSGDVIKYYAQFKKTKDTLMFLQMEDTNGKVKFAVIK